MKYFIQERTKWAKKNPEKAKQHIRDLYDKMFPKANDYINFLKPLWKNQKSILEVDLFRNRLKHQKSTNHLANKVNKLDENILNDCLVENDYWEKITPEQKTKYKDLTKRWVKSKTKQQRTIWNYYVLGVPQKRIASLLKKNEKNIIDIINKLQEDFLKRIPPL